MSAAILDLTTARSRRFENAPATRECDQSDRAEHQCRVLIYYMAGFLEQGESLRKRPGDLPDF